MKQLLLLLALGSAANAADAWEIKPLSWFCSHNQILAEYWPVLGFKIVLPNPGSYTLAAKRTDNPRAIVVADKQPLEAWVKWARPGDVIFVSYCGKTHRLVMPKSPCYDPEFQGEYTATKQ